MLNVKLQAHRGVSTDAPENTMSAFRLAIEQGYEYIELDPAVTSDGKIVVLHDKTLNRTARCKDGKELAETILISDVTYEQALEYDYGLWFGKEFEGEKIPLLSEVLDYLGDKNITLKIDNKIWHFKEEKLLELFSIAQKSHVKIGITCATLEAVNTTLKYFPEAEIHYDGAVTDEAIEYLSKNVDGNKLVIWMPYKCPLTSWVTTAFADEEICQKIKKYARLGIWIIHEYSDAEISVNKYHADIIETTGSIKH